MEVKVKRHIPLAPHFPSLSLKSVCVFVRGFKLYVVYVLSMQITSGFELYAVFSPLVSKQVAISGVNRLLRWIKKEEDRLFIINSLTI